MSRLCQTRQSISATSVSHPLLHPPKSTHTLSLVLPYSPSSVCPSLSASFHPSPVQFFISGSIFLTSAYSSSDDTSSSLSVFLCQSAPTPPNTRSLMKSIHLSMWRRPANHHVTVCAFIWTLCLCVSQGFTECTHNNHKVLHNKTQEIKV